MHKWMNANVDIIDMMNAVSLWGQEWEKAELHNIKTYYKAFSYEELEHADIEVKIGLNSVNITLKGRMIAFNQFKYTH